jgi:hypothetical protein
MAGIIGWAVCITIVVVVLLLMAAGAGLFGV